MEELDKTQIPSDANGLFIHVVNSAWKKAD